MPNLSRRVEEAGSALVLGVAFAVTLTVLALNEQWAGALGAVIAFAAAAVVLDLIGGDDEVERDWRRGAVPLTSGAHDERQGLTPDRELG